MIFIAHKPKTSHWGNANFFAQHQTCVGCHRTCRVPSILANGCELVVANRWASRYLVCHRCDTRHVRWVIPNSDEFWNSYWVSYLVRDLMCHRTRPMCYRRPHTRYMAYWVPCVACHSVHTYTSGALYLHHRYYTCPMWHPICYLTFPVHSTTYFLHVFTFFRLDFFCVSCLGFLHDLDRSSTSILVSCFETLISFIALLCLSKFILHPCCDIRWTPTCPVYSILVVLSLVHCNLYSVSQSLDTSGVRYTLS